MRKFNGHEVELLAPAGNFEIFKGVVQARCDGIYFGGQTLNMRMIRKGFNFTDEELKTAVDMAHAAGKRAYITVNNLVDQDEIESAKVYLNTLAQIKPDALIVQDMAIVELIRSLGLPLDLHASVMMNVHSASMVEVLKRHGITRVVLSREASLVDARRIHDATGVEIEYFTHGDMCIAHGASCYYSSMLFGMSSNRGKCLKPCRWWFSEKSNGTEKSFPLAVKDLSLYAHLPELMASGITSFKIEGRMREREFITALIDLYGEAMDRFIADPSTYDRELGLDWIENNRKRDLSHGYAFGKPGAINLNSRWEGTGKFYSTGKMFSVPTPERGVTPELTLKIKNDLHCTSVHASVGRTKLSVRVQNFEQACAALDTGVERLYLAMDVYLPDSPFSRQQILTLKKRCPKGSQLYMATPRMTTDHQLTEVKAWLEDIKDGIDGILVGNLGALSALKDLNLPIAGDFSLNVMNTEAKVFYFREGLQQVTASLELNSVYLRKMLQQTESVEVIGYGHLPSMYFEHDFYEALHRAENHGLKLYNEAGAFSIHKDAYGRNHMMTQKRLNMLPFFRELSDLGASMVRLEMQTESPEEITRIIRQFQSSMTGSTADALEFDSEEASRFTYGALVF